MTRIKQLSRKSSMNDADVFPVFDSVNAATRSVSFKILRDAVPNIVSVVYEQPNLIMTQSDGNIFTVNISDILDLISPDVKDNDLVIWDAGTNMFIPAGANKDATTGAIIFDQSIEVPQSSLNLSDTLSISEATLELFVRDHILGTNATGIISNITDLGSEPLTWQFVGLKSTIIPQPIFNTEFNSNPFVAPLLASATNQTDAVTFKTGAPMNNVRMTITDDVSGLVLKYIPTKIAVTSGVGGLNLIAGDNRIDFNSNLPDVPASGLFYIGFTPLRQFIGQAATLEIVGDSVSILGEPGGIPFFQNEIQFITPKTVNPAGEVIPPDPRNFYFAKGGDDAKSGTTIENANLTFQETVDKGNALIPPPELNEPVTIISIGSGVYNESISLSAFSVVDAPLVELVATTGDTLTVNSNSSVDIDAVAVVEASMDAILINNADDVSVKARFVSALGGLSNAVHLTGTSTDVFVSIERIRLEGNGSGGIFDETSSGTPRVYNIDEISLDGNGCIAVDFVPSDSAAEAILNVGSVTVGSGAANTVGFRVLDGIVTATVNDLSAAQAIVVQTNGTLNITANKVTGDIIVNGSGVLNCQITDHIGALTVAGTAVLKGFIGNNSEGTTVALSDVVVNGDVTASGIIQGGV